MKHMAILLSLVLAACVVGDDPPPDNDRQGHACTDPLVDEDQDGDWDGVDYNCDGVIDVRIPSTTTTTSSHNSCSVSISLNGQKRQVVCEDGTCTCRRNDVLEKTCTDNGHSCSIPGSCCGY
jgi:hypothetical protein